MGCGSRRNSFSTLRNRENRKCEFEKFMEKKIITTYRPT